MPPQLPSASWRRTIQLSARLSASERSGLIGWRSYARSSRSRRASQAPRREVGANGRQGWEPWSSFRSKSSLRHGLQVSTTESATTVWRAQQAKS